MTPADVLRELAAIAGLMVVWVAFILLMLERDRKRTERRGRYCVTETTETSSLGAGQPAPLPQSEEPRATAAHGETNA